MTKEQLAAQTAYLRSIRNPDKRAYADVVATYGPDSQAAQSLSGSLSYMAAQAVRMNLAAILDPHLESQP